MTEDNKFLFILDPEGVTKYEFASMEPLLKVSVTNNVSDLQISKDGDLLLVDNKWLLDLRDNETPVLQVLSNVVDLINRYDANFALSPDGSLIAVEQVRCNNICQHVFRLISTNNFESVFTQSSPTRQRIGGFSPKGTYFALIDELSGGSAVSVWNAKSPTLISSLNVRYPFRVSSVAFSQDESLLAVAQDDFIDLYDIESREIKVTIEGLCSSRYSRKIMFVPSSSDRLLEQSACGSGEWIISGNTATLVKTNVPDFSRETFFDKDGNLKVIPYPYPSWGLSRDMGTYFEFIDNEVLVFSLGSFFDRKKDFCYLFLTNGSLECTNYQLNIYSNVEDIQFGSDDKLYYYVRKGDKIDIYSLDNPEQVYYSMLFSYYLFDWKALDPVNGIIFYNIWFSSNSSKGVIQDIKNGRILAQWNEESYLETVAFAENHPIAVVCRKVSNTIRMNVDRLSVVDLLQRKIMYEIPFTCVSDAFSFTKDGSTLAASYFYLKAPTDQFFSVKTILLDTKTPFEKQYLDVSGPLAYSPVSSLLAVACSEYEICFIDSNSGKEIYRLKAHPRIKKLAFSEDGTTLAALTDWKQISIWAIPPFVPERKSEANNTIRLPTCLPGNDVFQYNENWHFEITPIKGADFYLWGFFQNGKPVWEYMGDSPDSYKYTILATSDEHNKFSPGQVEIWVRGNIKGKWTESIIWKICLSEDTLAGSP